MGMVVKDVQESDDNKSCIICDNMLTKSTIIGQLVLYMNIHPRPQQKQKVQEEEKKRKA